LGLRIPAVCQKNKLSLVIAELAKHLKDGRVIYISFKYDQEEEDWEGGRYFNCLNEDALKEIFTSPSLAARLDPAPEVAS
jgi:hypothetical protein